MLRQPEADVWERSDLRLASHARGHWFESGKVHHRIRA